MYIPMNNVQNIDYSTNNTAVPGSMINYTTNIAPVTMFGNDTKATVWFFSQRSIPNEVRRASVLNASTNDFNLSEIVCDTAESLYNSPIEMNIDSVLTNMDQNVLSTAIMPEIHGHVVQTSNFSTYWTWIMIVDNDYGLSRSGSIMTPKASSNRVLYMGICLDEPVTPNAMNGKHALNERCMLIVTHQTFIKINKSLSPGGTNIRTEILHDKDVVHSNLIKNTDTELGTTMEAKYLLDPMSIYKTSNFSPNYKEELYIQPDSASIDNQNGSYGIPLSSSLRNPQTQLRQMLKPIFNTATQSKQSEILGRGSDLGYTNGFPFTRDAIHDTMVQNVGNAYASPNQNVPLFGLDISKQWSIQDLVSRYPNIEIHPCKYTSCDFPVAVADSSAGTPVNIATSIISSSLQNLMVDTGLDAVAFMYSTAKPFLTTQIDRAEHNVEIKILKPMFNEDTGTVQYRWNHFLNLLKRRVLDVVQQILGGDDFEVYISCQNGGTCYVQIQPLSMTIPNKEYAITSTYLQGVNTPHIGDLNVLHHNAMSLGTLIPHVSQKLATTLNGQNMAAHY